VEDRSEIDKKMLLENMKETFLKAQAWIVDIKETG
jgi:hypothetical protein